MLGGLAVNSGFAAHEIERMDADAVLFWHDAIAAVYARAKGQS